MIQLAELDTRINDTWAEYEKDLQAAGADFVMHMYPQVNHGFHNDSTARYHEEQANIAWQRTVDFFNRYLRA